MLFEQNIASNVILKHAQAHGQARPQARAQAHAQALIEQLLGTYRNLLNLKKQKIFDFKKTSLGKKKKKKSVFRFAPNDWGE